MRAEIEIKEVESKYKVGFMRYATQRMFNLHPNLAFSSEEAAILTKYSLWGRIAWQFERNLTPRQLELMDGQTTLPISIQKLAQPDFFLGFDDPVEANSAARELEEQILPLIKNYITQASAPIGKRVVDL